MLYATLGLIWHLTSTQHTNRLKDYDIIKSDESSKREILIPNSSYGRSCDYLWSSTGIKLRHGDRTGQSRFEIRHGNQSFCVRLWIWHTQKKAKQIRGLIGWDAQIRQRHSSHFAGIRPGMPRELRTLKRLLKCDGKSWHLLCFFDYDAIIILVFCIWSWPTDIRRKAVMKTRQ